MEQYREAIVREILFRSIPPLLLVIISAIVIIILVKFAGLGDFKYSTFFTIATIVLIAIICSLIVFFNTKGLFADLNNNDFIEYYGEATFVSKQSNKEFNSFCLNDEDKTIVNSNIGNVESTINKCVAYVIYGRNSKFVILFEVKEIIEERPPINIT